MKYRKLLRKFVPNFILFFRAQYLNAKANNEELKKYKNFIATDKVTVRGNCDFAKGTKAGNNVTLLDVSLGDYSYFTGDSFARNCSIGKYCSIAPKVTIGLGEHPARDFVSSHPAFFFDVNQKTFVYSDKSYIREFPYTRHITIGNDVWIGNGALIKDGLNIGDGAIVGAGAVVVKDIEPYAIVGGVPARLIRYRFEPDQIEFLLKFKWWNKDEKWLRNNCKYFSDIHKFKALFCTK